MHKLPIEDAKELSESTLDREPHMLVETLRSKVIHTCAQTRMHGHRVGTHAKNIYITRAWGGLALHLLIPPKTPISSLLSVWRARQDVNMTWVHPASSMGSGRLTTSGS